MIKFETKYLLKKEIKKKFNTIFTNLLLYSIHNTNFVIIISLLLI